MPVISNEVRDFFPILFSKSHEEPELGIIIPFKTSCPSRLRREMNSFTNTNKSGDHDAFNSGSASLAKRSICSWRSG